MIAWDIRPSLFEYERFLFYINIIESICFYKIEKLSYAVEKSIAYINQIENKDTWPQPEMVDKIAVSLGISSSALFEENSSPENLKNGFAEKYGKAIEAELLSRIEKDVREVFRLL